MQPLQIYPSYLEGEVKIPPSKSLAHRAIICASLASGISKISNVDLSDDIIATVKGMQALGALINIEGDTLTVDGTYTFTKQEAKIDCNESGSTLRFLVPVSIARYNTIHFVGEGNLGKRPLDTFYNIFETQGIEYKYEKDILDLNIKGELQGDTFHIPGNISSQFISGLLFALPLAKNNSTIILTTHLESKGYIDLTLDIISKYGIEIENIDYHTFKIKGKQKYTAFDYTVEGDYSQAAFFESLKALGNNIVCKGLNPLSLQGDQACIAIIEKLQQKEVEVTIDAGQYPDIIPTITVVAALRTGMTHIINGSRLRIKECDRLHAITKELNGLGANITELEEGMTIKGVKSFTGGQVSTHDDHRIAMSLAVASTKCSEPVVLDNPTCVSKSYPNFWKDFQALGGKLNNNYASVE